MPTAYDPVSFFYTSLLARKNMDDEKLAVLYDLSTPIDFYSQPR